MAAAPLHAPAVDGQSMKNQSELLRALRAELAAKEKELADQKWVFEQFLQSPAWRWTAPIRWVANRIRALRNGHSPSNPATVSDTLDTSLEEGVGTPELESTIDLK